MFLVIFYKMTTRASSEGPSYCRAGLWRTEVLASSSDVAGPSGWLLALDESLALGGSIAREVIDPGAAGPLPVALGPEGAVTGRHSAVAKAEAAGGSWPLALPGVGPLAPRTRSLTPWPLALNRRESSEPTYSCVSNDSTFREPDPGGRAG